MFDDYLDRSGKTLTQLARDLGVSVGYASKLNSGDRAPGGALASRIQSVTGIPMAAWYVETPKCA